MTGARNAKEWQAGDTARYMAAGETALGFGVFIGKGAKAAVGAFKVGKSGGKVQSEIQGISNLLSYASFCRSKYW